jgi:hypothetical protein
MPRKEVAEWLDSPEKATQNTFTKGIFNSDSSLAGKATCMPLGGVDRQGE